MENIIKPKDFLTRLKNNQGPRAAVRASDLMEIGEIDFTIPLAEALDSPLFYTTLKRAVSDYNADAFLSGRDSVDFDDLHTKYGEYVDTLQMLI